jgi:hypothetical protein
MSENAALGEAIERASEHLAKPDGGDRQTTKSEPKQAREAPEKTVNDVQKDDDAWEGEPGWVKQWKGPNQKALRKLARLEGAQDYLPAVLKEVEDRYDYSGKQAAEFDNYRKRFDPYSQVLGSLEQRFQMQGVHPQTGLQQMAMVSDLLQRDPDQAYQFLFQNFKPRDAKALTQFIGQQFGVDLKGLLQDQPWVDPAIDARIQGVEAQNRQLMQLLQGAQSQQYEQGKKQVVDAIQAFQTATDENGELKYPYHERLMPAMTRLVYANGPAPLEQLYEQAAWLDPEIREKLMTDKARKAENQAIQDAKSQTEHVEEAVRASRNPSGSKSAAKSSNEKKSLDDTIKAVQKKLSNK